MSADLWDDGSLVGYQNKGVVHQPHLIVRADVLGGPIGRAPQYFGRPTKKEFDSPDLCWKLGPRQVGLVVR